MPTGTAIGAVVDDSVPGKPAVVVTLHVDDGPQSGKTITYRCVLSTDTPGGVRGFLRGMEAFGLGSKFFSGNPSMQQVADALYGRRARFTVSTDTQGLAVAEDVEPIQTR